ncbi:MAG: hypothetical protein CEE38_15820 [Planctomycetes bacterium B3_Pla]|nr:MAG: hypothetical protein CEE38_15820 [Planctomycetes bacterium B3_Pla]
MILASSVLTALVSGDFAYPAILCMLGLLGLQRRLTWDIKPEKRVITSLLLLLLAIMFAFHYRYGSSAGHAVGEQAAAVAWQTIARYFLASMILTLFLGSPDRLPFSLGLFHVAVTISAGQVLLLDDLYVAFRLSELLSVILVVLYIAAGGGAMDRPIPQRRARRSRQLAFALILLVTANCGWIASSILYRHVEVLNYLPVWFWRGASNLDSSTGGQFHVGFSTSGELSSVLMIKGDQDPTPMLSIKCDRSPGYLRARSFETYLDSKWLDRSNEEPVQPDNGPFGMYIVGRRNLFRLDNRDTSYCSYMTIRHESELADALFTPLGTVTLNAPLPLLLCADDGIVRTRNLRVGLNYEIAYSRAIYRKPPTSVQVRQMLDIPKQLESDIRQLSSRIFAGRTTTIKKIDAVVRHFRTNYTYFLGVDAPSDRDKLAYFLLEESVGYCEYFASGAAILLRMAGVPTRYVTGFVVTEKHPDGELWVARNMDAHAWVEAWDTERKQWTIVEATSEQNLGMISAVEQLEKLRGGSGTFLGQLLQAIYQYGLLGLPSWLYESYGISGGLFLPAAFLSAALGLALFRRYKRMKYGVPAQSDAAANPRLAPLHRMLAKMDRKVKAAGHHRDFGETLHAFSGRLRTRDGDDGLWTGISDWYLEYANLRYCRAINSERLHQLNQQTQALHDSL